MRFRARTLAACLCVSRVVFAQAPSTAPSIEGVWKIVEVVTTGANASTNDNPWPSLIVFTKNYYSFLSVNGVEPRPMFRTPQIPTKVTDAEKLAMYEQWVLFNAQAGPYEIKGTTIFVRPVVARNETTMNFRVALAREFTLEGDTLLLVTGTPGSETRTKLTRIE